MYTNSTRHLRGHEMKVLVLAPSAYPCGGVATWLNYLLPGMRRAGWKTVLGLLNGLHHDAEEYIRQHPDNDWLAIENPSGSKEGRVRALVRAISRVSPQLVLVVNVADAYLAAERIHQLNKGRATKFVMTLHGLEPEYFDDISRYSKIIDSIVVTNRLTREIIRTRTEYDVNRVFYAQYGVPVPDAQPRRIAGTRLELIYVGRLDDNQKRLRDIPRILEILGDQGPDFTLTVAGSGPDADGFLRSLSPWGSRVRHFGPLSAHQLSTDVYRPGAILLLTSQWETGPLVVWEAMSHGVPVVTSRYVGAGLEGSLSHDENCLMFEVGDVQSAAKQIARLSNPELCHKISRSAFELVKRNYDRETSISAWVNALNSTITLPRLTPEKAAHDVGKSGRLDEHFGTARAESLRRILGIRFKHNDPGSEWPHSHGGRSLLEDFRKYTFELDKQCHQ